MIARACAGFAIAVLIALFARRTRSLAPSGAAAAVIVGTIAVAAGWHWGLVLILYFASSNALSRLGRAEKERRTASIVAKGGERDAAQVLANGLVFAIAAMGMLISPSSAWLALGAGSLAASAADTWATEIGTLYGRKPRSILTLRPVRPGTSGGVSLPGLLAALAGATFIALLVVLRREAPNVVVLRREAAGDLLFFAITAAGVAGALIDSLLGATIQLRRWCDACSAETERRIHDCGSETKRLRGLGWLDNDMVNLLSNAAGGLLAALLVR